MAPDLKMILLISLVALMVHNRKADAAHQNHVMTTEYVNHTAEPLSIQDEDENKSAKNNISTSNGTITDVSSEESCPPLKVLDFLHFNSQNTVEVQEMEQTWPCEVRTYWLKMQGFVSVVRFLFTYVTIILVFFGLLVNSASLCVLNSPPINTSSISVYLRALALSDTGALLFNVTIGFLRAHSQTVDEFYLSNSAMCFIQRTLSIMFFYYSTWLVVALTFERFVVIKSPFSGYQNCNFRPSNCVVVILGCVCLIIGLIRTQLTGFESDNMYGYSPCVSSGKAKWNYYIIPFMAMTTTIPTILIFIGNICLLLQIRRSAQDNSSLKAASLEDGTSTFRITRMLMMISVTYFVLLVPVGVVGSIELYWKSSYQKHIRDTRENYIKWQQKMLLIKWIRGLLFFFFLLNYNINFFLYCVSGRKFRETVKICLQRWLPNFCKSTCHEQQKLSATYSQKHRSLVTSLSTLTLQQCESQSDRRTSDSSMNSEKGHYNVAFVDSESTLSSNKQCTTCKLPEFANQLKNAVA